MRTCVACFQVQKYNFLSIPQNFFSFFLIFHSKKVTTQLHCFFVYYGGISAPFDYKLSHRCITF